MVMRCFQTFQPHIIYYLSPYHDYSFLHEINRYIVVSIWSTKWIFRYHSADVKSFLELDVGWTEVMLKRSTIDENMLLSFMVNNCGNLRLLVGTN